MSTIHRRGVLLDGIGKELVRSANGGPRKTLSAWLANISDEIAQTFTSGDATPSVLHGAQFITAGSTAITDFDDATEGQVIFIYRGDADITITRDGTHIETLDGASVTLTATHPMISFRSASGVWREVERSDAVIKATGGSTANSLADRAGWEKHLQDYGTAIGDGTTDATSAANAANTAGGQIHMPAGVYATSHTDPISNLNSAVWVGPGQIEINGYAQAPWRSIITGAMTAPPSEDRYQFFHNGMPKAYRASSMGVFNSSTTPTSGSDYVNFPHLGADIHFHEIGSGVGFNVTTTGNTGGRSSLNAFHARGYHGGQGDFSLRDDYMEIFSARSGATHFLANPAALFMDGAMGISAVGGTGAYMQGLEWLFSDNGYRAACGGMVMNFSRTIATETLGEKWFAGRFQSVGSQALNFGISFVGKWTNGVDFTPAEGDLTHALNLAATQRINLSATSAADSTGAKWCATSQGNVYLVSTGSDFRIGLGGADELIATTTAFSPAASDGNALGTTALMWSDLFLASGAVINFNNGDVTVTHSSNVLAFAGAANGYTFDAGITVSSSSAFQPQNIVLNTASDANAGYMLMRKSRSGAAVQVGDTLGTFLFSGYDSSNNPQNGASLTSVVTAVGASSVTAKMQISAGSSTLEYNASSQLDLPSGGVLRVNSTQVVAGRDTGWTAMTGTPNKATAYDTATVTLPQLAGRVASIQAALTTHGLLGA